MIESKELNECFEDVKNSVNAAMGHYQIWFTLRGKGKVIDEYLKDMNDTRYVDFFHAANIGHYKLMFIELGCIFDSDKRTNRIRTLKELMRDKGLSNLASKFDQELESVQGLVSNILTIRSKLIAHRETGVELSALYNKHVNRTIFCYALL